MTNELCVMMNEYYCRSNPHLAHEIVYVLIRWIVPETPHGMEYLVVIKAAVLILVVTVEGILEVVVLINWEFF